MDILSYILSKKNSGSNPGGSGGSSSGSSASVEAAGGGTLVDPTQTYSRLYFNTKLTNEEIMALMNTLELTYEGVGNLLYTTIYRDSGGMDGILAGVMADTGTYVLMRMLTNEILFAINGNVIDETITFTGWNPNIDFSNGIEISGETVGTEFPIDGGSIPIGANNDKIANLFSSEPIKEPIHKGLSGAYDGTNLEVESTHINISALLDEHKLPLNINVVDDSLIPSNIVSGVNILGVEGSYRGTDIEDKLVARTLTTYTNDRVTDIGISAFQFYRDLISVHFANAINIRDSAFSGCISLTSADFPSATLISPYAFNNCSSLTNINAPLARGARKYAFGHCNSLTNVDFPKATYIETHAFEYCSKLRSIDCPGVITIGELAFTECNNLRSIDCSSITLIARYAFNNCYRLIKVFISQTDKICTLQVYPFNNCYHFSGYIDATYNPEGLKDGYIYVPASLLSQYKVATDWSTYASQIIGHEDLEVGATLPNYTTDRFTKQTWYSDERLTTVVTEVATTGKYYCRLEA